MRNVRKVWKNTARWLLIVLATGAAAACGSDATMPAEPDYQSVEGPTGSLFGWSSWNEDALKLLLRREQDRIDALRRNSDLYHETLKAIWDIYRRKPQLPGVGTTLLVCEPLQYQAESKVIGPEGGDISMGPHRLYIPKGALTQPTVITGEAPSSLNVEVKFSPHGLKFRYPPVLKLNYNHCDRPDDFEPVIVYLDDLGKILEVIGGFNQPNTGEFFGAISHFSKYAMATN